MDKVYDERHHPARRAEDREPPKQATDPRHGVQIGTVHVQGDLNIYVSRPEDAREMLHQTSTHAD